MRQTIDLTPTWETLARIMPPIYADTDYENKKGLQKEFNKMGRLADMAVKHWELIMATEDTQDENLDLANEQLAFQSPQILRRTQ